jgi:hypothetical protein
MSLFANYLTRKIHSLSIISGKRRILALRVAWAVLTASALMLPQSDGAKSGKVGPPVAEQAAITVPIAEQPVQPLYQVSEDGTAQLFVEMEGDSAAVVFAQRHKLYVGQAGSSGKQGLAGALRQAEKRAAAEALEAGQSIDQKLQELEKRLKSAPIDAIILYKCSTALNGIAIKAQPEQIDAILQLAGVKSVTPILLHKPTATTSVNFVGTRAIWNTGASNAHGEGVGVAVIDSGIDFVHTNMGGPGGSNYALNATATNGATPATTFPTSKVVWGYDFAGDAYTGSNGPVRDANPMDTGGHGSGCASLIGGFGVDSAGATYPGPYDSTNPNIAAMRISPGFAPQSGLYALRVFGTAGSSGVVNQAVDIATAVRIWQLAGGVPPQPAAVLALSPAAVPVPATPILSVANLSLGSNDGFFGANDSSTVAVQNAVNTGMTVACAAGNAYDIYYIMSSPAIATGCVAVAATYNAQQPGGNAVAPVNGAQPAINLPTVISTADALLSNATLSLPATSAIYANPPLADAQVTPGADLASQLTASLKDPNGVFINNADGSLNPLANNVYAGKVVLIDRGVASFHQKAHAANKANAAGVVIINNRPGLPPGFAATAGFPVVPIPVVGIAQEDGAPLTNTGVANTPPERPSLTYALLLEVPGLADSIVDYSSRGPRRGDNKLKPDISAPAENVTVELATSGNQVTTFNGTSSATPHTVGAAALLRQVTGSAGLTPAYTVEEMKAVLMNSVRNSPLLGGVGVGGPLYGAGRAGVGRLTLDPSGGIPTALAMNTDGDGSISLSYGVVNQPRAATGTYDKTFKIVNKAATSRTFNLTFSDLTAVPGVSWSFPGGPSVVVPGSTSTNVTLRMTAVGSALRNARELTVKSQQVFANGPPAVLMPRHFLSEATGYVMCSEVGGAGQAARLAAYAIVRPTGTVSVTPAALTLPSGSAAQNFTFGGDNINTGPNNDSLTNAVADIISHAKAFELQYQKPVSTETNQLRKRAEVQYAGVTSDFARRSNPYDASPTNNQSAVLVFAVAVHGDYEMPSARDADFRIDISFNGTTAAFNIRSVAWLEPSLGDGTLNSNIYLTASATGTTAPSTNNTGFFTGILPNKSPNLFNNSVVTIPVNLQRLGITSAANAKFFWRVRAISAGAAGATVTTMPFVPYDVSRPGIDTSSSGGAVNEPYLMNVLNPGQTFPVTVNTANFRNNASLGMLMVYPHNAPGSRAQAIIAPTGSTLVINSFSPPSGPVGTNVTLTGSGFTGATAVSFGAIPAVVFNVNTDTTINVTVPVGASTNTIRVTTPAGTAATKGKFIVTP